MNQEEIEKKIMFFKKCLKAMKKYNLKYCCEYCGWAEDTNGCQCTNDD